MSKRTKNYGDMPVGKLRRVENFLPPPEKLVLSDETVKITISLSRKSIDFFKHYAKLRHIKYQRMIRQLLDQYAGAYSNSI